MNNETILESVKGSLPPMMETADTGFDRQLLSQIDICLLDLAEIGCLRATIYQVDAETTWDDILIQPPKSEETDSIYSAIRSYVCLSVRLFFDTPVSGAVAIYQEKIKELFWRIEVAYHYAI